MYHIGIPLEPGLLKCWPPVEMVVRAKEQLLEQVWRQQQNCKLHLQVLQSLHHERHLLEHPKQKMKLKKSWVSFSRTLLFFLHSSSGLKGLFASFPEWLSHLFPWCPGKRKRWSQSWGWSWSPCPGWPALGRRPCTVMPRWSPLHLTSQQPFSLVLLNYENCWRTKMHAAVFALLGSISGMAQSQPEGSPTRSRAQRKTETRDHLLPRTGHHSRHIHHCTSHDHFPAAKKLISSIKKSYKCNQSPEGSQHSFGLSDHHNSLDVGKTFKAKW